jgi:monoamine oxidase
MQTETLVVGGGLAGLNAVWTLAAHGHDVHLVEARDRLGGRILTQHVQGGAFDMGPAWFWPGQPRLAERIRRLGLRSFEQYATGNAVFEDEHGRTQRGRGIASMAGSYRITGGMVALIDAMAKQVPDARILLRQTITGLTLGNQSVTATTAAGQQIRALNVLLALPLRVIADGIAFDPPLPQASQTEMQGVPTWMAGHAKAVVVYDHPFWREAGLSGDAISRRGPLAEIHDASPDTGGPFALFGFLGVSAKDRQDVPQLKADIVAQMERLFGPAARAPREILVKDWAFDALTATVRDQEPLFAHPRYDVPEGLRDTFDGRLAFAGTEVAAQFGGYLEGALEASDAAIQKLLPSRSFSALS